MKNIVMCCDGTRAQYGREADNTNVVRLYERLIPDGTRQISYYDPGVGTYSPLRGAARRILDRVAMAVSGSGVWANIREAYRYLMDHYEPGDRVFLFGYSRGAYTVRALAGLLHRCGLLTRGSSNLMPYAMKIHNRGAGNDEIAAGFKRSFSRECRPFLIGVWDTVASVGWIRREYFSNHRLNGDVTHGLQALSVDESRAHFQVALWDESAVPKHQKITQVWFPGCHADVGGQEADRRISDISLDWMLRSAADRGLLLREVWSEDLQPDPLGDTKASRTLVWRLFPAKQRDIPEGAILHSSVLTRMKSVGSSYRPSNLPGSYLEAE